MEIIRNNVFCVFRDARFVRLQLLEQRVGKSNTPRLSRRAGREIALDHFKRTHKCILGDGELRAQLASIFHCQTQPSCGPGPHLAQIIVNFRSDISVL